MGRQFKRYIKLKNNPEYTTNQYGVTIVRLETNIGIVMAYRQTAEAALLTFVKGTKLIGTCENLDPYKFHLIGWRLIKV